MHTNDNITPFREIVNIGKSTLTKLVSQSRPAYTSEKTRDYSLCSLGCQLYQFQCTSDENPNNTYCKEYCTKVIRKKYTLVEFTNYLNRPFKHIPGKFTHSQILQFIYMHFLPGSSNIRPRVSISHTAEALGLCTKTVINNIKKFIIEGLIYATKVDGDTYSVYLIDAKNYHATKEEGGTGYIPVSQELFFEILNIHNVNALRLEIRKLLKFDNMRVQRDSTKKGSFSFKNIKEILPKHINYKNAINKVINGASSIFETHRNENEEKIEFKLKTSYDGREIRRNKTPIYEIGFVKYIRNNTVLGDPPNVTLDDLTQMSFEYGYYTVLAAFKKYIDEYYNNNIVAKNLGAFIRSLIQKCILGQLQLTL